MLSRIFKFYVLMSAGVDPYTLFIFLIWEVIKLADYIASFNGLACLDPSNIYFASFLLLYLMRILFPHGFLNLRCLLSKNFDMNFSCCCFFYLILSIVSVSMALNDFCSFLCSGVLSNLVSLPVSWSSAGHALLTFSFHNSEISLPLIIFLSNSFPFVAVYFEI